MLISPQHMEIERVYAHTLAGGNRSLAIIAANAGEGVTTVAVALAQRNLMAGRSTLLVDMNLYRPALHSLLEMDKSDEAEVWLGQPQLVALQNENIALTGVTIPRRREVVMQLRRPGALEACIREWQQTFDTVIFDTSPLNRLNGNNIPPEQIAAACDASLLVVLAGSTNEAMVSSAVDKLKNAGAPLLGCLLNDRDNPPLKSELLREVARLEPHFNWLRKLLNKWLINNRLLSLDV